MKLSPKWFGRAQAVWMLGGVIVLTTPGCANDGGTPSSDADGQAVSSDSEPKTTNVDPYYSEGYSNVVRYSTPAASTSPPAADRDGESNAAPDAAAVNSPQNQNQEASDSSPKPGTAKVLSSHQITFRWIPPGKFLMGSAKDDQFDRKNPGRVETIISQGYWMSETEVTQELWTKVMGTRRFFFSPTGEGGEEIEGRNHKRLPAESMSWFDALEFCNRLSEAESLSPYYELKDIVREQGNIVSCAVSLLPGNGYRLPTEAEWEYACRAGTTTEYYYGDVLDKSLMNAFNDFNDPNNIHSPVEVKSYPPNPWGLYEMHGNVDEWCFDFYSNDFAGGIDPLNLKSSQEISHRGHRVYRGGSFFNENGAPSSIRGSYPPEQIDSFHVGVRLVRAR